MDIFLIFWRVIGDHVEYIFWTFGELDVISHTFMTIFVIQVAPLTSPEPQQLSLPN